jgi:hypothetical protein
MNWLLAKLFGPPEEINGHGRCPTYLYRWAILRLLGCAVYIHRFVGDDWSLDLHDHPKRFISIGLWGSYVEHTPKGAKRFRAPWLRTFPAKHIHRVTVDKRQECWTLVIVFRGYRQWGFWHLGRWIHWKSYVRGADANIADKQAVCQGIGEE